MSGDAPPLGADHAALYLLTRVGRALGYGPLPVVLSTLHRAAIGLGLATRRLSGTTRSSGEPTRAQFFPSVILLLAAAALPAALELYFHKLHCGRGMLLLVVLLLAMSE